MILPPCMRRSADFYLRLFFFLLLILTVNAEPSSAFDHAYAVYGSVLSVYVKNGLVDYSGLKSDPGGLRSFLESTERVQRREFESWPRREQLAFLINVYNARTLELVIDNYPVKSIKDTGSGGKGPWDRPIVKVFGETITLNELENGTIRKNYKEPRIHFALVCAAMGCPPLLDKPYAGAGLDAQLETRTKKFLSDTGKNSLDEKSKTLRLSPIFEWYAGDFEAEAGSVAGFLKEYYGGLPLDGYIIVYTDYDWSLNDNSDKME
ncbi:MAG TPA: DUF547 domain-containing protein [Thermodesulfobacteriota bacterium]|nr:DUF547 domain-containing protein [Thermodesulfobacteriota bacterium]